MSLPGDERMLASLAGFGRDLAAWQAVRADVIADWVQATDGRWYHAELAAWAIQAHQWKLAKEKFSERQSLRAQAGAAKRRQQSGDMDDASDTHAKDDANAQEDAHHGPAAAQPKSNNKNKNKNESKLIKQEREGGDARALLSEVTNAGTAVDETHRLKEVAQNGYEGEAVRREEVRSVFEFWKTKTNRPDTPFTADRQKLIAERLNDGFSVSLLKRAIEGASHDDFYQGRIPSKQNGRMDGLDVILRYPDRIERLASLDHTKKPTVNKPCTSAAAQVTASAFANLHSWPDRNTVDPTVIDVHATILETEQ